MKPLQTCLNCKPCSVNPIGWSLPRHLARKIPHCTNLLAVEAHRVFLIFVLRGSTIIEVVHFFNLPHGRKLGLKEHLHVRGDGGSIVRHAIKNYGIRLMQGDPANFENTACHNWVNSHLGVFPIR